MGNQNLCYQFVCDMLSVTEEVFYFRLYFAISNMPLCMQADVIIDNYQLFNFEMSLAQFNIYLSHT